jgi:hypothetical protein
MYSSEITNLESFDETKQIYHSFLNTQTMLFGFAIFFEKFLQYL